MQLFGTWVNHTRDGSKIVLYEESLLQGITIEEIYPPESKAPSVHAQQAHRILAAICQVTPEEFSSNNMAPRLPFFLGDASERMFNGLIYGVDPEMFALGVASIFHGCEDDVRYSSMGVPGRKWMPLNALGFAASFVSIFPPALFTPLFLTLFLAPHRVS